MPLTLSEAQREIDTLRHALSEGSNMLCSLLYAMKDAGMLDAISRHYDAERYGVSLEQMMQWFEARKAEGWSPR